MAHTGDTEELESLLHRWAISAAVVRIGGREIISIGDVARPVPVHSIRKSLISALYGQAHDRGLIRLERTISDVGIDDTPALTDTEKAATIEDLLTARSGIYLPLPAGVAGPDRPARGAHPPGMHWHYNNWDFNVLATSTSASPIAASISRLSTIWPVPSGYATGPCTSTAPTNIGSTHSAETSDTPTTPSACPPATSLPSGTSTPVKDGTTRLN
jgi:hypothetical protein